jgi:hypothetical protein
LDWAGKRAASHGFAGVTDKVQMEFVIAGACKSHKTCGQAGRADIVYIDEQRNTIYVWEVKSY